VYVLVQYMVERIWYVAGVGYLVRDILPLQLCGISTVLTIVLLLTRSRRVYEVVYFLGLAGATMAMLMPEVEFDFPHPLFLIYFTGHASIVYCVVYMTWVHGYRPTFDSIRKVFIVTNAYVLFTAGANLALDTNYLYISRGASCAARGHTACAVRFRGRWRP